MVAFGDVAQGFPLLVLLIVVCTVSFMFLRGCNRGDPVFPRCAVTSGLWFVAPTMSPPILPPRVLPCLNGFLR